MELKLTKCQYCSSKIYYNTSIKRVVEINTPERIHICPGRIVKCQYCGEEIYFSFRKNKNGKRTAFSVQTQSSHRCAH